MQLFATIAPIRKVEGIISPHFSLLGQAFLKPKEVDGEGGAPKKASFVMFVPPIQAITGTATIVEVPEEVVRTVLKDADGYILKDSNGYILTV